MTNTLMNPWTDDAGNQFWYTDYALHRDDGPAVIYKEGDLFWYQQGKIHREGAPAFIRNNGDLFWYLHDKLHRLNGPAAITKQSGHAWYINGVDITQEVNTWMTENNITYPWDEQTQVEFVLRWG
jgi:hypothetical protein